MQFCVAATLAPRCTYEVQWWHDGRNHRVAAVLARQDGCLLVTATGFLCAARSRTRNTAKTLRH